MWYTPAIFAICIGPHRCRRPEPPPEAESVVSTGVGTRYVLVHLAVVGARVRACACGWLAWLWTSMCGVCYLCQPPRPHALPKDSVRQPLSHPRMFPGSPNHPVIGAARHRCTGVGLAEPRLTQRRRHMRLCSPHTAGGQGQPCFPQRGPLRPSRRHYSHTWGPRNPGGTFGGNVLAPAWSPSQAHCAAEHQRLLDRIDRLAHADHGQRVRIQEHGRHGFLRGGHPCRGHSSAKGKVAVEWWWWS